MTDKQKTIQEALAEVQHKMNEANWDVKDFSAEKDFSEPKAPEVSSKPKVSAPKVKPTTKPTPGVLSTIGKTIARNPKTALAGAALAAGTAALGSEGIKKTKEWANDVIGLNKTPDQSSANLNKAGEKVGITTPSTTPASVGRTGVGINKVMNRSSETAKTSTPEAPKETPKPTSFSQAFKTAREKATEIGKPSAGQFEFQGKKFQTNVAGEKYVPMSQQTKVDTTKSETVPLPPSRPTDLNKPESESGGKRKKMSEDTNPLIASFLALQEKNPSNMFVEAKKLSKKQDEKLDVVDDDKIDAKDFAALRAGKKKVDEAALKDPKDPSVQGSGDVTMEPAKPAAPAAAPVHVKPTNPEKLKNLKDPRDPSVQGSGDVTYKEEVTFSQAEIDHINSFFLEASVAPTRPEVAAGADSTSDKMSQNDVTGTSTESGKRKVKEEVELDEVRTMSVSGSHYPWMNKPKVTADAAKKSQDYYAWAKAERAKNDAAKAAEKKPVKEETLEEGRPRKNPTPETTERDPRKHIQVEAGRAAAGSVVDFTHNDGSKSKITPAMGRRITAHLQGLKPADRQSAVNRMHDSAEGLKV